MEILNINHHKKILVQKALARSATRKEAARLLGVSERSLYLLMNEFNLKACGIKTFIPSPTKKTINEKKLPPGRGPGNSDDLLPHLSGVTDPCARIKEAGPGKQQTGTTADRKASVG